MSPVAQDLAKILVVAGDIDLSKYASLLERAKEAFRIDPSYAIAVAKPAGALVARRQERAASRLPGLDSPKSRV